jgi:hypothetical protein
MILFHRTTEEAAASILRNGFKDATGRYGTTQDWTGVWVSNIPLRAGLGGAEGNAFLRIALRAHAAKLSEFEWVEKGKGYREWLIPAVLLNKYGKVMRVA